MKRINKQKFSAISVKMVDVNSLKTINDADAYDAMTNDRSYRKSMSKEVAINELKKFRCPV